MYIKIAWTLTQILDVIALYGYLGVFGSGFCAFQCCHFFPFFAIDTHVTTCAAVDDFDNYTAVSDVTTFSGSSYFVVRFSPSGHMDVKGGVFPLKSVL